jgi:Zn-finger nucleic acid-binding protein
MERRPSEVSCPRDHAVMKASRTKEAVLDTCGKCGGQFFDSGEMFAAFGIKADPSYWDRPETGGSVRDGHLHCPACEKVMLIQDVKYAEHKVEIDRCRSCGGIWLDKGEVQTIMAIGDKIKPVLDAETAAAKAELDKMGEPDFSSPGLIAQFLAMFKKGEKGGA